jgi:hypothetical protein
MVRQLRFAEGHCRALLGPRCIGTMDISERNEFFYNVAHINTRGHAALGERFAAAMSELKRRERAVRPCRNRPR